MNDSKPGLLGTNRGKLLVTAGVAAVALIGISSVIDFPIGGTTTTGAIVPAERHRAPQNAAGDIAVGQPSAAVPTGTTIDAATGDAAGQAAMKAGIAASRVASQADAAIRNNADAKAAAVAANTAEARAAAVAAAKAGASADAKANLMRQ